MPRSSWSAQNKLNDIFVDFLICLCLDIFFNLLVFGLFILISVLGKSFFGVYFIYFLK